MADDDGLSHALQELGDIVDVAADGAEADVSRAMTMATQIESEAVIPLPCKERHEVFFPIPGRGPGSMDEEDLSAATTADRVEEPTGNSSGVAFDVKLLHCLIPPQQALLQDMKS